MKKIVSVIVILFCVSVLLAANSNKNDISPAQTKSIEKEILKVHENMKKAAESRNADELFKYVLDVNDVIIENGEMRSTRKEAYDITKQGLEAIQGISYKYDHKNVIVTSPTTALLTGTGTTTATLPGGLEISLDFAESMVYVLRDGQWKVVNGHRSSNMR